jgi:hypothetical protein
MIIMSRDRTCVRENMTFQRRLDRKAEGWTATAFFVQCCYPYKIVIQFNNNSDSSTRTCIDPRHYF